MADEAVAQANPPTETTSIFDELDQAEQVADTGSESSAEATGNATDEPTVTDVASDEEDHDWLPTEQQKDFSDDDYARYATRYKLSPQEAADPRNRLWLKDKINSDVKIRRQEEELTQLKAKQQPEPDEQDEPVNEPTVDPAQVNAQWFQGVKQYVEQKTDPKIAAEFFDEFITVLGGDKKSYTADQKVGFTRTLSTYAINLMRDAVPDLLFGASQQDGRSHAQRWLETTYEGIGESHQHSARSAAWESLRQSKAEYSKLPAYGTAQYQQATEKLAEMMPGFEHFHYNDPKTGRSASPLANFKMKSELAARLLSGTLTQKQVELTKQAVEKGKELQKKATVTAQAGNLGTGQSKGQVTQASGNDDIFGAPGEVKISERM